MGTVESDLLDMSVEALRKAYEEVSNLKCDFAVAPTRSGKFDTLGLDVVPEEVIIHEVMGYDPSIVLITEETGKNYAGERGLESTQSVLICDPTDRTIKMRRFLQGMMAMEPGYNRKTVNEAFREGLEHWRRGIKAPSEDDPRKKERVDMGPGPPSITGACGSITAIRHKRILFNAMVNYVTGELFVADSLGTRRGDIQSYGRRSMASVRFPSERKGHKFVTFLGKSGYTENLEKCNLGLDPADDIDPWTGGPLRILRLSELDDSRASFILSNGEKVCEWIGWLAWVSHAMDPVQSNEHAMEAYRLFFESPRTKELVLVAPGPHYSMFTTEDGETVVDLNRMLQLKDPSHYRETLLITPRHNVGAIARVKSLGDYQGKLML
ncbi:MAG: hypothetical protein FJY76_01110 [Candidatus Aenigmarchaeota archaeon]|nr:hypothetical protein [Candidatus Aenigmarchaeota archaeon]